MGPYVIHDISTGGALHLATLDGEQMPTWISGFQVKKYLKLLMLEVLEWLHNTKEQAQCSLQMKQQALMEAKEQEAKHKYQRSWPQDPEVHLLESCR